MAGILDSVTGDVDDAMRAVTRALRDATKAAMKDAGALAKIELTRTAALGPGPDRVFSNWAGHPKLEATARVEQGAVLVTPRGPWINEDGAPPHGGHPGTRSTQSFHAWSLGRDATFEQLGIAIPDHIGDAVEHAFQEA